MGANYSPDQVRALVESYQEIVEKSDTTPHGLYALVRVADIDRALEQLPLKHWEVVLLHGMLGLPARAAAELLHVSHQAVSKRYRQALEELHYVINGGE